MGILGSVVSCCGLFPYKSYSTYYWDIYQVWIHVCMLGDRGLVLWCMVNLLVLLGLFGAAEPDLWFDAILVVSLGSFGDFEYVHWFDVILLGGLDYHFWFDDILCLVEHPYCLVMLFYLCPMTYLC